MFEEIIICVSLAIVPVLLWAIPKTRRMTGTWLTALKTVPLGCLTAFLIPTLLYGIVRFINNWREPFPVRNLGHIQLYYLLGIVAIALVVGILLTVYLVRFIWHRYHVEGKRSMLPFLLIVFLLVMSTIVLSVAIPIVQYHNDMSNYRRGWIAFVLPTENDVKIAFEQHPIHPFLAEYNYRLHFKHNGKTEYRDLQTNTGGRTFFNIYRLQDGRLYFVDKDNEYIVDTAKQEILYIIRDQAKLYVVPYPQIKFSSWGWRMESGRMLFHHDDQKTEAHPVSVNLSEKTYYGCITNDFYSAAERAEEPIERRR